MKDCEFELEGGDSERRRGRPRWVVELLVGGGRAEERRRLRPLWGEVVGVEVEDSVWGLGMSSFGCGCGWVLG